MGQGRVLRRLQREVRALAPAEGWWETGAPRMWACRFSGEKVQMPRIQLPYLYLVLDGALRLHTPSGILDYEAGQYSISRIDTPLRGTVLAPSREEDLLALALAFTANQVIEVVLALDRELTERIAGEGLVLSITLVPGKAYTAAVTQLQNQGRGRGGCRGGVPDGHSGQRSQDHPGGGGISPVLPGKDCRRHRRGRGERRSRTAPSRSMWPPSLKS